MTDNNITVKINNVTTVPCEDFGQALLFSPDESPRQIHSLYEDVENGCWKDVDTDEIIFDNKSRGCYDQLKKDFDL